MGKTSCSAVRSVHFSACRSACVRVSQPLQRALHARAATVAIVCAAPPSAMGNLDDVLVEIGEWGRFQLLTYAITGLAALQGGMVTMVSIFADQEPRELSVDFGRCPTLATPAAANMSTCDAPACARVVLDAYASSAGSFGLICDRAWLSGAWVICRCSRARRELTPLQDYLQLHILQATLLAVLLLGPVRTALVASGPCWCRICCSRCLSCSAGLRPVRPPTLPFVS